MKHLKTAKGKFGNVIKFYTLEDAPNVVLVHDTSAQMERLYTVGEIQELINYEPTLITSVDQVVNVWSNGEIHF